MKTGRGKDELHNKIGVLRGSKIYVLCPENVVTVGPESLHNLVHHLCLLGHNAFIVYIPDAGAETPQPFLSYFVRRASRIDDSEENLIIVPEIWTGVLANYNNIRKSIWWLSVDNYMCAGRGFNFTSPENGDVIHLAQSKYVEQFLRSNGVPHVYGLNSSIHPSFRTSRLRGSRDDIILYNPRKGFEFTKLLMEKSPGIKWVALEDMNREQLIALMRRSKVYVDLGHFPGKDRLPRESVLNGCCIVTGLRGAARLYEDMPIPDFYKVETEPFRPAEAMIPIHLCLHAYDECREDFEPYRRMVLSEEAGFRRELRRLFGRGKKSVALVYRMLPVLLHAQKISRLVPPAMKRGIKKLIPKSVLSAVRRAAQVNSCL